MLQNTWWEQLKGGRILLTHGFRGISVRRRGRMHGSRSRKWAGHISFTQRKQKGKTGKRGEAINPHWHSSSSKLHRQRHLLEQNIQTPEPVEDISHLNCHSLCTSLLGPRESSYWSHHQAAERCLNHPSAGTSVSHRSWVKVRKTCKISSPMPEVIFGV